MTIDLLVATVLWLAQAPQLQAPPLPQVDLAVEVVANVPLHTRISDYSRLLAKRQQTRSFNRVYPPLTLEIIRLVKSNPRQPRGKRWDSIGAVSLGYDAETKEVIVEYCVDFCTNDPGTGAPDPKRTMVSYGAQEATVVARLNKQLDKLKKYAD
jgi:hypothetical protein